MFDSALIVATALAVASCSRISPENPDNGDDVDVRTPAADVPVVPMVTTPASELAVSGYEHTEVLRIKRDFGRDDFEIALDAWVPINDPSEISDVRLWWYKTGKDGERGPFSAKTKRHFEIDYERQGPAQWRMDLVSDRKRFSFIIELNEDGKPFAHGNVVLSGGARIERCRVTRGELLARKIFGAPIGIKRLNVTCFDQEGTEQSGRLTTRNPRK